MNLDKTILNLANSTDARAFYNNEILHLQEFERIQDWIANDIKRSKVIENNRSRFDRRRNHETITILGTRGSGKTSFLLSILTWADKMFNDEVEVLDIVDPTLIEEKGHIFLNIFSIIQNKVDNVLGDEIGNSQKLNNLAQEWHQIIIKLAHGLPHMDGIGGNLTDTTWQDPEYIMQRGLLSVKSARDLEVNFTEAVSIALKILKKKAFIIAFDDIDIDFKKGWPVLELLRKYFVSNQLITILSGDMRLYSLSVRKRQWQNFGDEVVQHEGKTQEQIDHLRDLVTETESQYLQKVMKPIRRVHLSTLYDKLRIYPKHSIEVEAADNKSVRIRDLYTAIFKRYGINNNYQIETYMSFLLNSPLRFQIRFLESNTIPLSEVKNSLVKDWVMINNGIPDLIDPFISDLYEMNIDVERITGSPQQLNIAILELLIREKILSETNQLQPTTTKSAVNGTLTALTLLFSKVAESNPVLIFDYFVRIGYLRNLLSSLIYERDETSLERSVVAPTIQRLCKHAGIFQDRVVKDNIGMVTAYMIAVRALHGNNDQPWAGIIPLRALASKPNMRSEFSQNRINMIANRIDPIRRAIMLFPLSISQSAINQKGTVNYSFYVLLATITEFIRKANHDDVFRGISELSQIRQYPMPDLRNANERYDDIDENDIDYLEESSTKGHQKLQHLITDWCTSFDKITTPPHLLGKISTRFFFAADTIQNIQKNEKLGKIMHALTVAFLNSVLVEDIKEGDNRPDVNLNNPRLTDGILLSNLRKTNFDNDELRLSRWIFSCPLLIAYLNPSSELIDAIIDFSDENLVRSAASLSVYAYLQEVNPKSRMIKPKSYQKIITQLIEIAQQHNLLDEMLNGEEWDMILDMHSIAYPLEKISLPTMKRVIDYYNLEEID